MVWYFIPGPISCPETLTHCLLDFWKIVFFKKRTEPPGKNTGSTKEGDAFIRRGAQFNSILHLLDLLGAPSINPSIPTRINASRVDLEAASWCPTHPTPYGKAKVEMAIYPSAKERSQLREVLRRQGGRMVVESLSGIFSGWWQRDFVVPVFHLGHSDCYAHQSGRSPQPLMRSRGFLGVELAKANDANKVWSIPKNIDAKKCSKYVILQVDRRKSNIEKSILNTAMIRQWL